MARKSLPDHEGRMPDHPRYGNPSDPTEEVERVRAAYESFDKWQRKYGGEFSGSVSMSVGDGKVYTVPVGDREIAQKVVSRPIAYTTPVARALPEPAEAAPEPPPIPVTAPQSCLARLLNRIKGAFRWT